MKDLAVFSYGCIESDLYCIAFEGFLGISLEYTRNQTRICDNGRCLLQTKCYVVNANAEKNKKQTRTSSLIAHLRPGNNYCTVTS